MGLTFKKQDDLEKLFNKFASIPDPKKVSDKKSDKDKKSKK